MHVFNHTVCKVNLLILPSRFHVPICLHTLRTFLIHTSLGDGNGVKCTATSWYLENTTLVVLPVIFSHFPGGLTYEWPRVGRAPRWVFKVAVIHSMKSVSRCSLINYQKGETSFTNSL